MDDKDRYEQMYFELFHTITHVIDELRRAQHRAEAMYVGEEVLPQPKTDE